LWCLVHCYVPAAAVAAAAAPATKILAQPGTITGSIGVLAARIQIKEALGEYGVTSDTVQLGDNASWASGFHTLTEQQTQMVRENDPSLVKNYT
jgi:protease-4